MIILKLQITRECIISLMYYKFGQIGPQTKAKVCVQWRILKPPGGLLATDPSKASVLVKFLLNFLEWVFRVVICVLLWFICVWAVVDYLPRLGKRELICLLLFACNCVVSVWRGFLFL